MEQDLANAQASVAGLEAKIVQNQQTIQDLEQLKVKLRESDQQQKQVLQQCQLLKEDSNID